MEPKYSLSPREKIPINSKDIVAGLKLALSKWTDKHEETKELVAELKEYYAKNMEKEDDMGKEDVINQAKKDKGKIKEKLDAHQDISAEAQKWALRLKTKVQSSRSGVQKIRKYGQPAVVAFMALGVLRGSKVPEFVRVITVVVGADAPANLRAILGGICFGGFALATYLILRNPAQKMKEFWEAVEGDKDVKEGLSRLRNEMVPKRRQLVEISNLLDELQRGNYKNKTEKIVTQMGNYIDDNCQHL